MSFRIVPNDVITHAGSVEGIGADLKAAGEKGAGVDLGAETYGIIGQIFSLKARQSISEVSASIAELASALPSVADGLRDCADVTQQTDGDHASIFDKFQRGE